MQSGLRVIDNPISVTQPSNRPYLMWGQVTSPVPLDSPHYAEYQERCLRTWSVDVKLATGELVSSARVLSPQGNSREGRRQLPRLPRKTAAGETIPGDTVVVAFLNGEYTGPVVIGTLSALPDASVSLADMEQNQITGRDTNERQDRIEHVDTTDTEAPLVTSHTVRSTGREVQTEHRGERRVGGQRLGAQRLETHDGGRSIDVEQVVQVTPTTTAVVREFNTDGTKLSRVHLIDAPSGKSTVQVSDIGAKLLQLTQNVEDASKLLLQSDNAMKLLLQHETPHLRTTAFSSDKSKMAGVLVEDLDERTRSGWSVGPKGELIVRRINAANQETKVEFNDDDSLTIQNAKGVTIDLTDGEMLITTGGTTVMLTENDGLHLMSKGGTVVSVADDAVSVSGPQCTIAADSVHLSTGAVLVGNTVPAAAKHAPTTEALYAKLAKLEASIAALYAWARIHTHPVVTNTGVGNATPTLTQPTGTATVGSFTPATVVTDSFSSFKGV